MLLQLICLVLEVFTEIQQHLLCFADLVIGFVQRCDALIEGGLQLPDQRLVALLESRPLFPFSLQALVVSSRSLIKLGSVLLNQLRGAVAEDLLDVVAKLGQLSLQLLPSS